MKGIPLERGLIYFSLLCLLPLVFVGVHLYSQLQTSRETREELEAIQRRAVMQQQRGMRNTLIRRRYLGADPLYLNKVLEPLSLLEREHTDLHALIEHEPSLPNKEVLQRYEFLESGGNRLSFAEGVVQNSSGLRETMERLTSPVEVDGKDLETILHHIEDESKDKPHLIVTDFKVSRKKTPLHNEVFSLDIKLLKREYLQ